MNARNRAEDFDIHKIVPKYENVYNDSKLIEIMKRKDFLKLSSASSFFSRFKITRHKSL